MATTEKDFRVKNGLIVAQDATIGGTLDANALQIGGTAVATESYVTTQIASYVTTQIANIIDSAPSTLDTLNELAAAINDDANVYTTLTNSIATKQDDVNLSLSAGTPSIIDSVTSSTVTTSDLTISSAQYKWGSASIYSNGTGTPTITLPAAAQWNPDSDTITVEFWYRNSNVVNGFQPIIQFNNASNTDSAIFFTTGEIRGFVTGFGNYGSSNPTFDTVQNTWHHVVIVSEANGRFWCGVDGSGVSVLSFPGYWPDFTEIRMKGNIYNGVATAHYDDIRITTSNVYSINTTTSLSTYTVPTSQVSAIAGTVALIQDGSSPGTLSTTDNITANSFTGDGSNLTGISSYADSDVISLLSSYGSNTISTTGTIETNGNMYAGRVGTNEVSAHAISNNIDLTLRGGTVSNGIRLQFWDGSWVDALSIREGTHDIVAAYPTSVTDTTAATSTSTGAVVVSGGVGVAGNVHAAQFHGDGSNLTNLPASGDPAGTGVAMAIALG